MMSFVGSKRSLIAADEKPRKVLKLHEESSVHSTNSIYDEHATDNDVIMFVQKLTNGHYDNIDNENQYIDENEYHENACVYQNSYYGDMINEIQRTNNDGIENEYHNTNNENTCENQNSFYCDMKNYIQYRNDNEIENEYHENACMYQNSYYGEMINEIQRTNNEGIENEYHDTNNENTCEYENNVTNDDIDDIDEYENSYLCNMINDIDIENLNGYVCNMINDNQVIKNDIDIENQYTETQIADECRNTLFCLEINSRSKKGSPFNVTDNLKLDAADKKIFRLEQRSIGKMRCITLSEFPNSVKEVIINLFGETFAISKQAGNQTELQKKSWGNLITFDESMFPVQFYLRPVSQTDKSSSRLFITTVTYNNGKFINETVSLVDLVVGDHKIESSPATQAIKQEKRMDVVGIWTLLVIFLDTYFFFINICNFMCRFIIFNSQNQKTFL